MFDEEPDRDPHGECRAEVARLTAELSAARLEVDCGQDGPCAKAPGCARHWQERNRELVDELAAARAVPADVEAAIDAYEARVTSLVTSMTGRAADDAAAVDVARNDLRAAIAEARTARDVEWQARIAPLHPSRTGDGCDSGDPIDWTVAALRLTRNDADDAIAEARQPATVGGLLATARAKFDAVEFMSRSGDGEWTQVNGALGKQYVRVWTSGRKWIDIDGDDALLTGDDYAQPARLVLAAEADRDPNQRGPLPKGG